MSFDWITDSAFGWSNDTGSDDLREALLDFLVCRNAIFHFNHIREVRTRYNVAGREDDAQHHAWLSEEMIRSQEEARNYVSGSNRVPYNPEIVTWREYVEAMSVEHTDQSLDDVAQHLEVMEREHLAIVAARNVLESCLGILKK
jgi:hypothetical protein